MQQELAKIEMEAKRLENAKMAADQKRTEADTALTLIRAQQEALKDPNGAESQNRADELKLAQAEADKEQELADLALRKYEIDRNLEIKQEELRLKELEIRENSRAQLRLVETKKAEAKEKAPAKKEGKANG